MKMKSFIAIYIVVILLSLTFNSFASSNLSIGNTVSLEYIALNYHPKMKKGMKWVYSMKAPFANGNVSSEVIDVTGENLKIKFKSLKKSEEKTLNVKDFYFLPQPKKNVVKASDIKTKYYGVEMLTVLGKSYRSYKFSGQIETPRGKVDSTSWYVDNIGLVKTEASAKILGFNVSVLFELKEFIPM